MKTQLKYYVGALDKTWKAALLAMLMIGGSAVSVSAQKNNSAAAPIGAPNGIGWNPGGLAGNNGMGNQGNLGGMNNPNNNLNNPLNNPNNGPAPMNPNNNPGPGFGPMGGGPVNWNPAPAVIVQQPVIPAQGTEKVIACGYDAEGIWRVVPLSVSYQYNGVQYNVTVLSAWDPWTDQWNLGVDAPAYNTNYYLRGVTYDFYCPLSTGTYYFNL